MGGWIEIEGPDRTGEKSPSELNPVKEDHRQSADEKGE
jgi:hypothetical protein